MSRKRNDENPELIKNFSDFISNYIIDNKLNNTSFGKLIGVDEGTIRKYRNGTALPSHSKMRVILSVTHTRYHEALGFEDPKHSTNEGQE